MIDREEIQRIKDQLKQDLAYLLPKKKEVTINSFKEFIKYVGYKYADTVFQKQYDMVDFAFNKENGTRLLLGMRGIGKTELVVILGVLYAIHKNKNEKILIIQQNHEKGKNIIRAMTSYIKNYPELFHGAKCNAEYINISSNSKDKTIDISSIGAALRSRRTTLIIMEDCLTLEKCTATDKQLLEDKYNECFALDNENKNPNILIVGNLVHKDDLHNKLRLNPNIPTFSIFNDDVPKEFQKDIEQLRLNGGDEYTINANYLGVIGEEKGKALSDLKIKNVDCYKSLSAYVFLDCSLTTGNDYTALTVLTINPSKEEYNIYGYLFHKSWYDAGDDIHETLSNFKNIKGLGYETNSVGVTLANDFRERYSTKWEGFHSKDKKSHRIALIPTLKKHIVLNDSMFNKEYNEQVINWDTTSKNDDAPDSLSNLLINFGFVEFRDD